MVIPIQWKYGLPAYYFNAGIAKKKCTCQDSTSWGLKMWSDVIAYNGKHIFIEFVNYVWKILSEMFLWVVFMQTPGEVRLRRPVDLRFPSKISGNWYPEWACVQIVVLLLLYGDVIMFMYISIYLYIYIYTHIETIKYIVICIIHQYSFAIFLYKLTSRQPCVQTDLVKWS